MKGATVGVIKVKSGNALLRVLLVCIGIYLNSVLRYKFLISDSYHPDIYIYVSKDVRVRGYFRSRKGSTSKKVWETMFNGECLCLSWNYYGIKYLKIQESSK